MRSCLYVFIVPTLWVIVDAINFQYPGDEYGGWGVASLPGLWALLVVDTSGNVSRTLPYILAAGGLTMAVLGWLMDRLRTPVIPWLGLVALFAGLIGAHSLAQFPSWERAMAKNGSLQAYLFPALNLGLLGATVLMIVIMFLRHLVCWLWRAGAGPQKAASLGAADDGLDL